MSDTPNRDDLEGATVEPETPEVTALLKRIDRLERIVEGLQGELQKSRFTRWAMRRPRGNAKRSLEAGEFIVRDAKGQRRTKLEPAV